MKNPNTFSSRLAYALLWVPCAIWGGAFLAVAVTCFIVVVGFPVGIIALAVAVAPWKALETHRVKQRLAWKAEQERLLYFGPDLPRPWEVR